MDKFQKIAFGLMLVFSYQVYAQSSVSDANQTTLAVKDPQCPSKKFTDFLNAFTENVEIQKAFTKFPLKIQESDAESRATSSLISYKQNQIKFPVILNAADRVVESLNIRVDQLNTRHGKLTLINSNIDYKISYEFVKSDCWYLVNVEEILKNEAKKIQIDQDNWLTKIFPMINECTPSNFYYDSQLGESNKRILENKGYKPYKVGEFEANYRVDERFYGLNVIEVSIPSGTDSIFSVTVLATANKLAKRILHRTGQKISVYNPPYDGFKAKSGVSYIVPERALRSTFICFTYEEGL